MVLKLPMPVPSIGRSCTMAHEATQVCTRNEAESGRLNAYTPANKTAPSATHAAAAFSQRLYVFFQPEKTFTYTAPHKPYTAPKATHAPLLCVKNRLIRPILHSTSHFFWRETKYCAAIKKDEKTIKSPKKLGFAKVENTRGPKNPCHGIKSTPATKRFSTCKRP